MKDIDVNFPTDSFIEQAEVDIIKEVRKNTSDWISVEDRLPIIGEEVVFCGIKDPFIRPVYGFFVGNAPYAIKFLSVKDIIYNNIITHWMPLPDAPKIVERYLDEDKSSSLQVLVAKLDRIASSYYREE